MNSETKPTAYVASRYQLKETVREIYKELEGIGFEIPRDWTQHLPIKPYEQHSELARDYSIVDLDAAANCSVFIIITDEAGTGMYVELGAAVLSNLLRGKPRIYAVGDHTSRVMFYYHPVVNRRNKMEEVYTELRELMKVS